MHGIAQHDQTHAVQRLRRCGALVNVAGDHGQLGLKINPQSLAGANDVIARAPQVVTAALVEQGLGGTGRRHLTQPSLVHNAQGLRERRAANPLVGARQGRHALVRVKGKRMAGFAKIQRVGQVLQLRGNEVPVVQHLLELVGHAGRIMRDAQVPGDNHQLAVAGSVFVSGKFHGRVRAY